MKTEDLELAGEPASVEAPSATDLRRAFRYCLGVFLAIRVGLSLLALAGVALLPNLEPVGVPGWPAPEAGPGLENVVTAWERFDGLWFLRIATDGYVNGDGSAAFFPLYPLLIRILSPILGGHPLAAALLISNAAFFGSLVLLYLLTNHEYDDTMARRAVLYLAVFPTSFFFLAPYSESLFLLLVLGTILAARLGRWELAGVAGALAAATRNIGVLLMAPLVVEGIQRLREGRAAELRRATLAAAFIALGLVAYLAFWKQLSGDWLAPLHQQANWQREFSFPLLTLLSGTQEAFRFIGTYPGGYHLVDWLIVAPAIAAAVWVALRTRPLYGIYTWFSLLAPLSFIFTPRPFMSLPRFLLPIFPIFWAAAIWAGRRRGVHEALVAASAAGLGILTILFVNWYYIF
ncbi:MAG: mannosyltransferase family protein [Actinomycetota bacterium]